MKKQYKFASHKKETYLSATPLKNNRYVPFPYLSIYLSIYIALPLSSELVSPWLALADCTCSHGYMATQKAINISYGDEL